MQPSIVLYPQNFMISCFQTSKIDIYVWKLVGFFLRAMYSQMARQQCSYSSGDEEGDVSNTQGHSCASETHRGPRFACSPAIDKAMRHVRNVLACVPKETITLLLSALRPKVKGKIDHQRRIPMVIGALFDVDVNTVRTILSKSTNSKKLSVAQRLSSVELKPLDLRYRPVDLRPVDLTSQTSTVLIREALFLSTTPMGAIQFPGLCTRLAADGVDMGNKYHDSRFSVRLE